MLHKFALALDETFDVRINCFLPAEGTLLFNEPDYFLLHSHSPNDIHAQLCRRSDDRVYATLAFHATADHVLVSPGRGTFGGLGLNGALDFLVVDRFLQIVVDYLIGRGAKQICIRCAPASHDLALFSVVFNALSKQGFVVDKQEINFDMRIDHRPFIERIEYGNVKRIRKAERAGFASEAVGLDALPLVHSLIANNRARLGVSVSMSLPQLQQMVTLFPHRIRLFAAYNADRGIDMVAAAVCLELAPCILYVLYWGDCDGMRTYSPVAMLAANIYAFCQHNGFKVLDVGISTLQGVPNYGLMNFKRNLGFTESLKLDMLLRCNE